MRQQAILGGDPHRDAPAAPATAPIVFEPPWPLVREPELWVIAAGDREHWGGATVAWSEDGDWYAENAEGDIGAEAVVGTLLDALPAAGAAPWRVACEYRGTLRAGDAGSLLRQQTLCYLGDSGGTVYELLCYSTLHLTGRVFNRHIYQVTGNLRRGCYGTPVGHHPPGTRFARLDAQVARLTIPDRLRAVGATLRLRIVSEFGGEPENQEDPADVEPLTYVLRGTFDQCGASP